jgi:hypothetical protein
LLWLTAGCGGGGAVAIDDLGPGLERALCREAVACGQAPDEKTCEASVFVDQESSLLTLKAAVARGTVAYDANAAGECLRDVPTDCAAFHPDPEACNQVFQGKVPGGGTCVDSLECANEGDCVKPPDCSGLSCCAGSCIAGTGRVPIGGDCSSGARCVAGATCYRGNTCAVPASAGASCFVVSDCQPGLVCEASTCAFAPKEGEACDPNRTSPCLSTADYCDTVSLTCKKRKPPGQACTDNDCVGYAPCTSGVCRLLPTAGQPCSDSGTCFANLVCASSGICAAPDPGVACTP